MSEDLYEGIRCWGTFALRQGMNSQTITLLVKEEGDAAITELITFTAVNGKLIYSAANPGLRLQKGNTREE